MGKRQAFINKAKEYANKNMICDYFCNKYGMRGNWCAIFNCVTARDAGCGDSIPWSASCNDQIAWYKTKGLFDYYSEVNWNAIQVGDNIYYDWDHINESKPADHVGIIVGIEGNTLTVAEGNINSPNWWSSVTGYRKIQKGNSCIFGFAYPNFGDDGDDVITPAPTNNSGNYGPTPKIDWGNYPYDEKIKELQQILRKEGYNLSIDGQAGNETYGIVKNKTIKYGKTGPLCKWVQERLNQKGFNCGVVDGEVGPNTISGIEDFQRANGLGEGYLGGTDWYYLLK